MMANTQTQRIVCDFSLLVTPDNTQAMKVNYPTTSRSSQDEKIPDHSHTKTFLQNSFINPASEHHQNLVIEKTNLNGVTIQITEFVSASTYQ